jgi:hypothetical protein
MKQLLGQIGETVQRRTAEAKLIPLEDDARKYILEEFAANGKPPTLSALMRKMRLSSK